MRLRASFFSKFFWRRMPLLNSPPTSQLAPTPLLCTFFRYVNQLSIAPIASITHRVPPFQSRHIHDLAYVFPIARTNQYMYSFFPHTIHLWNNLPDFVVHSESLVTFKHSLQCIIVLILWMYASISCTLFHASLAFMCIKKNQKNLCAHQHTLQNQHCLCTSQT